MLLILSELTNQDFIDKDSADADLMELCMLIGVDFEDVDPINLNGDFNV